METAKKHNLFVVEDAAQAIESYYKSKPLGGIGHFGCFSFHETKNIQCGEGGMLVVNDERFVKRAEIIWEKGTNRAEFFRGEVNKYSWVDIGSSFLPSDINAAFLYAQLEHLDDIQNKRKKIWKQYHERLQALAEKGKIKIPQIPDYATNNAHMFYILLNSSKQRNQLIQKLKQENIHSVFHYLSLHKSPYYFHKYNGDELVLSDNYTDCLLRLPFYYELSSEEINLICDIINGSIE